MKSASFLLVSFDIRRKRRTKTNLTHPNKELVILKTPSPVLIAHSIHLIVVLARYEQNAPNECWVVIFGVQLWRGNVKGTFLGETVEQLWVFWEEVNVMHCDIVTALAGLLEANIDEGGSVEPPLVSLIDILRKYFRIGRQPD